MAYKCIDFHLKSHKNKQSKREKQFFINKGKTLGTVKTV